MKDLTIREILSKIEYVMVVDGVEKKCDIVFSTWMDNMMKKSQKLSGYSSEKVFDPVERDNFQRYIAILYYSGLLPQKVVETRTNEVKDGCYVFKVETFGKLNVE